MIGEALAVACADRAVLARLGGALGDGARRGQHELAAATSSERRTVRAKLVAAVRAPIPPGIRGVDPSWIEAGLAGLPERARRALAAGPRDPIDVWLVRRACAELPPLPALDARDAAPRELADAIRCRADVLARWLVELGADQLALAVRGAGPDATRQVAARLGADGARLLAAAVRIDRPPRAGALGPPRAAIARCRELPDRDPLARIGARALAPHVDAVAARQLVVRLPRPRGLAILGELVAHARTPLDHAPAWAALAAAW
ncbi:MAG TPA: hypothetical protein VFQ53_29300 [Kofleriaceae bacterium]|nr:hypothetical protein [Kofleriaceae bacterium]